MLMVEIAMNPQGYWVHAGAVLQRYAPDQNHATPAEYQIRL